MGMQHVAAQATLIDKKTGLPQLGSEFCGLFMWGRGREGQLGVGTHQDNSVPKMVDELKGRRVLKVSLSDSLQAVYVGYVPCCLWWIQTQNFQGSWHLCNDSQQLHHGGLVRHNPACRSVLQLLESDLLAAMWQPPASAVFVTVFGKAEGESTLF